MNEVSLDIRGAKAGELRKANFYFYHPKVTFPMAQTGITEATDLESVNLGSCQTV